MKKFLVVIFISVFLFNCTKPNKHKIEYKLVGVVVIPDSLKEKHHEWITRNIQNSNRNTSFNKVKYQSDVIKELRYQADELFGVEEVGLSFYPDNLTHMIIVSPENFTPRQRKIRDSLLIEYKY